MAITEEALKEADDQVTIPPKVTNIGLQILVITNIWKNTSMHKILHCFRHISSFARKLLPELIRRNDYSQGEQIGRIFAYWAIDCGSFW
jgi:hypothetical protein